MKRVKTMLAALATVVLLAAPAGADHGTGTVFYVNDDAGVQWSNTATESVCMTQEWWTMLGLGKANNAAGAAAEALSRWPGDTEININFNVNGQPGCANFDWTDRYNNGGGSQPGFCDLVPTNSPSTIHYEALSAVGSSAVALNVNCDLNNNGIIDYFSTVINSQQLTENGTHWNFEPGSLPQTDEWDAPGVFMHEAGHAVGHDVHWSGTGSGEPCQSTQSGWNTMCANANGYSGGRTWSRTLELHDIGEANQIYP